MGSNFNFQDLMKFQMFMNVSSAANPLISIIALNLYERAAANYGAWWPSVKQIFCPRQKSVHSTPPPPNKEIRSAVECERILQSSTQNQKQQQTFQNHTRMDSVIHHVTTIPEIKNLLCISHSDYLPYEFEPAEVENDIYFQLLNLKHTDGQIEFIKFKLFSYEHEVQFIQAFIDRCNLDYERRMANKLGTSLFFFDMMTNSKSKKSIQNSLPTSHIPY